MKNEKKLTAQIAAAYWGCEAKGQDLRNLDFAPSIGKIVEVSENKITIEGEAADSTGGYYEFMPFEVQLILKPLHEISDEDAVEVARIVFEHEEGFVYSVSKKEDRIEVLINENISMAIYHSSDIAAMFVHMGNYLPTFNITKAINFLRSHSYDCDNLIEAGIAITITKNKTEL